MKPSRRNLLQIGGGLLAGIAAPGFAESGRPVEIRMQGNADGSDVWFDPLGLHVQPGRTIRWVNLDAGNSHTVTAYHPRNMGRPRRIPEGAEPWDSDYLLPEETFSITLTVEGVYDFFCIPHEHAGMVGRIVVGRPLGIGIAPLQQVSAEPIPEIALRAFPSIDEIIGQGAVHRR